MKIKQLKNENINSFEFSINLSEKEYLKNLLQLFQLNNVYCCIYGLIHSNKLLNKCQTLGIYNFKSLNSMDYVLEIPTNNISKLMFEIKDNFDEIIIWDSNLKWELFCEGMEKKEKFLTLYKTKHINNYNFYLNFKPYDFNSVEIIADLLLDNVGNISTNDIDKCCK